MADRIDCVVEVATKRAFAGGLGWPGWCRAGRSEEAPSRPRSPTRTQGGKRWLPRSFVRRVAWHVPDHAWEIEDRAGYRGTRLP